MTGFIGPYEVRIQDAFIYLKSEPISFGAEVRGGVRDCMIRQGGVTPSLFRRQRLQRFAPFASRVRDMRAFWRETA